MTKRANSTSSNNHSILADYVIELHRKRQRLISEQVRKDFRLKRIYYSHLLDYYREASNSIRQQIESVRLSPVPVGENGSRVDAVSAVAGSDESAVAVVGVDLLARDLQRATDSLPVIEDDWSLISSTLIPIVHRYRINFQANKLNNLQTIASAAVSAHETYFSSAVEKSEAIIAKHSIRNKKACREMSLFWRKHEKEERESRKRAEKEAVEKARQEEEEMERRRQAKKLQFLLTQTELYSHFVGSKLDKESAAVSSMVPEPSSDNNRKQRASNDIDFDGLSEQELNELAKKKAQDALLAQRSKAKSFDAQTASTFKSAELSSLSTQSIPQPKMLNCQLKPYQLKGLNWMANLYEQGINGILADEMGLGKTVQSISLLAYLAETHEIWGPFLVVSPASTLHNWQQEFTKFTPQLKALPYWGDVKSRKTLRKFWSGHKLFTKDSPFHVVITSYQLVVTDQQYFQRTKWQYMILDEAHAIKSANTARWKTLLHFNCRNRLLLTGTPIQNSMAELWALLHFIMPTIFDSHEEFAEWFSRDIETHAVDRNKGKLNERQLQRLHSILKPFMLRRVKSDVENELGQKVEKTVYCELTSRQQKMYDSLDKTGVEKMFEGAQDGNGTDETLMNMVMQFRKVCNHPQLFELASVTSPFAFGGQFGGGPIEFITDRIRSEIELRIPRLVWEMLRMKQKWQVLWHPINFPFDSIARLCGYSAGEVCKIVNSGMFQRALCEFSSQHVRDIQRLHRNVSLVQHPYSTVEIAKQSDAGSGILHRLCNIFEYDAHSTGHSIRQMPALCFLEPVLAPPVDIHCDSQSFVIARRRLQRCPEVLASLYGIDLYLPRHDRGLKELVSTRRIRHDIPAQGFSFIQVPNPRQLLLESGKLLALDKLLQKLKSEGHRALIFFQMTKMIDLMEEYLGFKKYQYLRLDGSSKISERRDMVSDWQTNPELFLFLLSTRAGGLGINLTAADTVIFYDSDWNPTVDQQAMDRAHRLGQTKQVTVYRLICQGTIEERILERALQKDEIQKVVISDGAFAQEGIQ